MSKALDRDLYEEDFFAWTQTQARQLRQFVRTRPNLPLDLTRIAPEPFVRYCGLCGWVLAPAHARTGDAAAISGYPGSGTVFAFILAFPEVIAQTERPLVPAAQPALPQPDRA